MGSYKAHEFLVAFYYRYKDNDKLCAAAKDAYDRFGLEPFSWEITQAPAMIEYIQNTCQTFVEGRTYTSEEMRFDYLKDIKTEESKMVQAMILSMPPYRDYTEVKIIFEELAASYNQKIKANSELCLSMMYYWGKGTGLYL